MVSTKTVAIIAIIDVLMATILIIAYIVLMSDKLPELELVKGSKKKNIILYVYVAAFTLIQLLFGFKFYRVLTEHQEDDDDDVYDLLKTSKYWLISSYILLINWIIKAGIYSQQCNDCSISIALAVYLIEIAFRIVAIYTVNAYITELEKKMEMRERQLKLQALLLLRKIRRDESNNVIVLNE